MIGMSIKGLEVFLPQSSGSLSGGVVLGRKVAFLKSLHVILDCEFLSEAWASP